MPKGPEFLIRGKDDFTLRKVSSLEAASFFRPIQVAPDQYKVQETQEGGSAYLIQSLATGKILRLSPRGFELWNWMDGKTSLRTLAAGFFLKYGAFDFEEIRQLIFQLKGAGLIESKIPLVHVQRFLNRFHHPVSRLFSRALSTWLSLDFKIQNVDQRISWIYAKTGWVLFHKVFIDASLVLGGWATFLFVKSFVCLHYTPASFLDAPWKWLVAYLILIPVIPIHELAHALTTKHFGYRVRDFGFTLLHHVLPVFYADVTDIWMASAHVRMKVAFAGPYSSWLLGSLAVLASLFFPRYEFIFYLFAFNCYVGTLINLYPFLFLEMDGYYILIDLLKFPHLRKEAIHALKNISSFGREKKQGIPLAYGLISIVSIGLILTYSIWSFLNGKI